MDFMGPVRRFDEYQQKRKALGLAVAVVKKFGDDRGGNLAALVAYFAFFSLFPLLLVFTTILGFVLRNNPSAQQSVESSV
ncbi:MAG: ribonuclease BN, partial [Solirubrobacteraceae bacterium]